MSIKRKILFFVALMSLFVLITMMQNTYAKYVSSADATAEFTVARWNILINYQDILQNSDFSDTILPEFEGTNYIKQGVIAPTAEGYFEITLDGTDTDVSYTYTITANISPDSDVTDLELYKYEIDNVEYTYNPSTGITNSTAYDALDKTVTVKFYVRWNDDPATQNMTNADDTNATIDGIAAFDIHVNVIQMH